MRGSTRAQHFMRKDGTTTVGAAWTVRDRNDDLASSIKESFSKDPFEDEDGCFLIREGAGFYE